MLYVVLHNATFLIENILLLKINLKFLRFTIDSSLNDFKNRFDFSKCKILFQHTLSNMMINQSIYNKDIFSDLIFC